MMEHRTKIVLVDDFPVLSEGLKKVLSGVEGIEVAARFSNGTDVLQYLNHTEVDLIIQDVTLPDMSGGELCRNIKLKYPKTVVLVLSHYHNRKTIMDILSTGSNGYLLKNTSLEELVNCIHGALRGEIVFSRDVKKIIASLQLAIFEEPIHTTNREKEVLRLISIGKTTIEMAKHLSISKFTVESQSDKLYCSK